MKKRPEIVFCQKRQHAVRTEQLCRPEKQRSKKRSEEKFKEIAEAYAILSDPQKRAAYDRGGFAGVEGLSPEDLCGGINFGEIFGGRGCGFNLGGEGIFDRFFHQRTLVPPVQQREPFLNRILSAPDLLDLVQRQELLI